MKRHRVLIIHESPATCDSLTAALGSDAIECAHVTEPFEGVRRAGAEEFDLILVGNSSGEPEGLESFWKSREKAGLEGVPVVVLGGEDGACHRIEAFEHGAIDYVLPPFDLVEMEARVRAILRQRENDRRTGAENYDPVTGCFNRRRLDAALEIILEKANFGVTSFLLYADLDNFAIVNELAGEAAGDRLLKDVSQVLRNNTQPSDVICRMGSDEFTVVLEGVDERGAIHTANRLRQVLDNFRFVNNGRSFPVSVSIGITGIKGCLNPADALNRAQAACRQVKTRGGNAWEMIKTEPPEQTQLSADTEWFIRVKDALKEDRMEIWLQPIVPLKENLRLFHEELIRMRGSDGELSNPARFLSAAERFGKAHEIDRLVLSKGLRLLRDHPDLNLSVNLAARTFNDPNWPNWAADSLAQSGVQPSRISFEITETTVIQDLKHAQGIMGRLKALGCQFALDDFGVGVSSLRYLRDLPVDYVKIDGGFVETIDSDPVNRVLVKSINDVAHSLGKLTVAEYVASESVLHVVEDLEVDFAQGRYVGEVGPPDQVLGS